MGRIYPSPYDEHTIIGTVNDIILELAQPSNQGLVHIYLELYWRSGSERLTKCFVGEEKNLIAIFGTDYVLYKKNTPTYIPFIY